MRVTGYRHGCGFDIYSVGGIIWIQVLHIIPFAFFTLRGPMISMDSSLEEAGYASGANPWAVIRRVTLPLMIFPLLSSLLLCFVLSVEQFAIPAMVGIPRSQASITLGHGAMYLLTGFSPPNTGLEPRPSALAMSAVTGLSIFLQRARSSGGTAAPTVTGRGCGVRSTRARRSWRIPSPTPSACSTMAARVSSFLPPSR